MGSSVAPLLRTFNRLHIVGIVIGGAQQIAPCEPLIAPTIRRAKGEVVMAAAVMGQWKEHCLEWAVHVNAPA